MGRPPSSLGEGMNVHQKVWWEQTRSDHAVLLLLRKHNAGPCHQLHYLQMVTEKLGKAYFWRKGRTPRPLHTSFVRFLQALYNRREPEVTRVAEVFGFARSEDFGNWIPTVTPLAHALERLAPALAGFHAPNPEYPWPHAAPIHAPAGYDFPIWSQLVNTGRGRNLLKFIDTVVRRLNIYE